MPPRLPTKNLIAVRQSKHLWEHPGNWNRIIGLSNHLTSYQLFVGVYPYSISRFSRPNFQPDVPKLMASYDLPPEDTRLGEFAAEAGRARYSTFPMLAEDVTWFIRHNLTPENGDLSDLIGTGYHSVGSTPLRYWNVYPTDVETFSSIATLDLPKSRCRRHRFGDLARRFASLTGGRITITLTYSGSGASSQARDDR